jgi:arabinofuranosyltransferase
VLYLAYVVKIGGDFMSGRFMTAPLVVALVVGVRGWGWLPRGVWMGGAVAVAALGLVMERSPLRNTAMYGDRHRALEESHEWGGVADERRYYAFGMSVLDLVHEPTRPFHITRSSSLDYLAELPAGTVLVAPNIGIRGYASGPNVYHLDVLALADPLLARMMPFSRSEWRAGHLPRALPRGYVEGLEAGKNMIADPDLALYYDHLCVITRGPVWSFKRWGRIVRMHLGVYDGLVHHERYRE